MKLKMLLEQLDYTCVCGTEEVEVTEVVYDSRKVKPGCLFLCIRGRTLTDMNSRQKQ